MNIIEYTPKYREAFIQFNQDWIIDNFGILEEEDRKTFERIDEELEAGGMIYFAVEGETPLATCMVRPMDGVTWELCKMGSNKYAPHKGCGSAVFKAASQWAIDHGAKRLFIVTNRTLKPAIHIYEKNGFQEIKLDNYEYARGDIAFEKWV